MRVSVDEERMLASPIRMVVAVLVLLACSDTYAEEPPPPDAAARAEAAALALAGRSSVELVRELGSASWYRRVAAGRLLAEQGEAAREALNVGSSDPDPEISLRAAQVLDTIGRSAREQKREEEASSVEGLDPDDLEAVVMALETAVMPEAEIAPLQAWFDEQSQILRARIGQEHRHDRIVRRVVDFHTRVLGLHVVPPSGSRDLLLSSLRDEKQGDALTIAACMVILARRAGVEVAMSASPGRLLLVFGDPAGEASWLDVEAGGVILDREQVESLLINLPRIIYEAEHLGAASEEALAERLLQMTGHMAMREGAPAVRESIGRLQDRIRAHRENEE